jgi:hypothetical protein
VTAGNVPSVDRWRTITTRGISMSVPIATARFGAPRATGPTCSAPASDHLASTRCGDAYTACLWRVGLGSVVDALNGPGSWLCGGAPQSFCEAAGVRAATFRPILLTTFRQTLVSESLDDLIRSRVRAPLPCPSQTASRDGDPTAVLRGVPALEDRAGSAPRGAARGGHGGRRAHPRAGRDSRGRRAAPVHRLADDPCGWSRPVRWSDCGLRSDVPRLPDTGGSRWVTHTRAASSGPAGGLIPSRNERTQLQSKTDGGDYP